MGATCRPDSVNTWRTPSALSMRTRSCAPVEVGVWAGRAVCGLRLSHARSAASARRFRGLAEAGQAGRKLGERRDLFVRVEAPGALVEHFLGLDDLRIGDAAVDRAHRRA